MTCWRRDGVGVMVGTAVFEDSGCEGKGSWNGALEMTVFVVVFF